MVAVQVELRVMEKPQPNVRALRRMVGNRGARTAGGMERQRTKVTKEKQRRMKMTNSLPWRPILVKRNVIIRTRETMEENGCLRKALHLHLLLPLRHLRVAPRRNHLSYHRPPPHCCLSSPQRRLTPRTCHSSGFRDDRFSCILADGRSGAVVKLVASGVPLPRATSTRSPWPPHSSRRRKNHHHRSQVASVVQRRAFVARVNGRRPSAARPGTTIVRWCDLKSVSRASSQPSFPRTARPRRAPPPCPLQR